MVYYRSISVLCKAGLFLSICCCASERSHSFRIVEEDGIPVALTTFGPRYEGELFEYEEVLRLQQDTTKQESLLFRPERFLMDENGCFYIADVSNNRVAVFDQNGRYSHSFGREGRGPGEFLYPRILYINKGSIAINDVSLNRTTTFGTEGLLDDVYTVSLTTAGSPTVYPCEDGSRVIDILRWDRKPNTYYHQWHDISGISADGDTLFSFKTPKTVMGFNYPTGIEDRQGLTYIAYGGWPITLYVPDRGILTTTGEEPIFRWYDLSGNVRSVIHADINATPVSNEERSAIIETFQRRLRMARNDQVKTQIQNQINALQIPETKGFWSEVLVDEYGYIWAGEPILGYLRPEEGRVYKVFSPEGEYLGDTIWRHYQWGTPSRSHFLTIIRDQETGESIPTVFRINPAVEGLIYP